MKLLLPLLCCAAWMQAQAPADSQLLNEVRLLRHDLAVTTLAVQRTQILLYRLQIADAAMTRATQRADESRTRLAAVQQRHKNRADQIQTLEARLNLPPDPSLKESLPDIIAQFKSEMESWAPDEQDAQTRQIDAETQLRTEQAKRDALEAALDKLDKQLEGATVRQ
jgi:chromosome segregation ATPase